METSAKNGDNSTKVFIEAAKILHQDYLNNPGSRSASMSKKSERGDINKKFTNMGQGRGDEDRGENSCSNSCGIF